jgi:hypothetical protein
MELDLESWVASSTAGRFWATGEVAEVPSWLLGTWGEYLKCLSEYTLCSGHSRTGAFIDSHSLT